MTNTATRDDLRTLINQLNARKSTGPKTTEGKLASRMNAFKHGLTGNTMILQPHEKAAYDKLTADLLRDHAPASEIERQLVLKIIDTSFRLNRISAIESNVLNYNLQMCSNPDAADPGLDAIGAQALAWMNNSATFERLGRYEGRLSKQLIAYQHELKSIQRDRKDEERKAAAEQERLAAASRDLASFGSKPTLVMRSTHSAGQNSAPPPGGSTTLNPTSAHTAPETARTAPSMP